MRCHYACGSAEHLPLAARLPRGRARRRGTVGSLGFGTLVQPAAASNARPRRRSACSSSGWPAASASSKPGTPSRAPTPAARSRPSRPPCPASTSANCCRTPRSRCTAWPWSAASTPPRTTTARATYIMHTGRRPEPAMTYPHLGAVVAKLLGSDDSPLPGYIHITPARRRRLQQAGRRLPRPALRLRDARRRQAAGQPAPPRRR